MKGTNTLILSEAESKEALQEYINKRFTINTPKVTFLSINCLGRLEITLEEKEDVNSVLNIINEIKKYSCEALNPEVVDPIAESYQEGYNAAIKHIVTNLEQNLYENLSN